MPTLQATQNYTHKIYYLKNEISSHRQPYISIKDETSIFQEIILKEVQIIIPNSLWRKALQMIHTASVNSKVLKNVFIGKA